jgi:hypothetical protein
LPLSTKAVNEKLDIVIETSEKVKNDSVFEKKNLFLEGGVSTVRFDHNEQHPFVATLQLIKH